MAGGKDRIIGFLRDNPDHSWNARRVANNTGLSERTVGKYFNELEKLRLIKKKSRGFYQYVKKEIKTIDDYLKTKEINVHIVNFLKDITNKKTPLRIHYLRSNKINGRGYYDQVSEKIITGSRTNGKGVIEQTKYGLTKFIIYPNNSIEVQYTGTFNGGGISYKKSLTRERYREWCIYVDSRLEVLFNENRKNSFIVQCGFNYDINGGIARKDINKLENFRFTYLDNIYEFYDYIDEKGILNKRVGFHPDIKTKQLTFDNVFDFGHFQANSIEKANKIISDQDELKQVPRQQKRIIELLDSYTNLISVIPDSFRKTSEFIIEKTQSQISSIESDIKYQNKFFASEIDKVNSVIFEIQNNLSKITDFIQNQNIINESIIESGDSFRTEIIDVIREVQNSTNQIANMIIKDNKDRDSDNRFTFYLLQRQLHNLPGRFVEKLSESKLYLIKWFNRGR